MAIVISATGMTYSAGAKVAGMHKMWPAEIVSCILFDLCTATSKDKKISFGHLEKEGELLVSIK
jgi:hypothetical protein